MRLLGTLLLGSTLVVAGCSGGGTSAPSGPSVVATPTPTPAPTSTPTPTPTPTANANLTTLVASETFPVGVARISFYTSSIGLSFPKSDFVPFAGGSTLGYDLASDSYVWALGPEMDQTAVASVPPRFTPAFLTATSATLRTWTVPGLITHSFNLSRNGQPALLSLNYVGYGIHESSVAMSVNAENHARALIYGVQTPAAVVPRSGTSSFTSVVDGRYFSQVAITISGPAERQRVGGTATVAVNWTTGLLTITLDLTGTDIAVDGTPVPTLGTWTGTATIASGTNRFSGTISGNGFTADVSGAIFGPSATEFGFVARGLRTRPRNFPPPDTSTVTDGVALAVVGRAN